MKRFKDRKYLEHMTEKEIKQWREMKAEIQRIHSRTFLALISNYAGYRKEREWELEREREREQHIKHMKSLPVGTKVLIRFNSLANHYATIRSHGRKYVHLDVDNGEAWRYGYWEITDKIDDEKEKHIAKLNSDFQETVAPILNEVVRDMEAGN